LSKEGLRVLAFAEIENAGKLANADKDFKGLKELDNYDSFE
jgi:hypothetical protein